MAELSGPTTPVPGSIDRSERPGRVGLLLVLAGLLVGAAIGLSFVANEQAQSLIVWLLALLAMAGVFFLFALAIGAIQLAGQGARDDITKAVVDGSPDAALVVEEGGRLIYANEAYLQVAGGDSFSNLRSVERVFVGSPEVSEAIYRLSQASRDGRSHAEEIRMSPPPQGGIQGGVQGGVQGNAQGSAQGGGSGGTAPGRDFAWYRIHVRPLPRPGRSASLWTVSDITAERERQENVFQELQHAIDYLDHAPAGFLSIDPQGAIVYMNATLAAWLGYDLATVGSGGPHLDAIAPGAEVLTRSHGLPGEVRTDRIDLDLRRRNGHPLPARLYHRIAFGKDGKPGASRTFVINRSAGAEFDEPQRAAEVRLARFLNTSPIAIATLDRRGRIARANASFARLFGTMPRHAVEDGTDAAEEPNIVDSVADRDGLDAALAKAASGLTEVAPIEISLSGAGSRSARVWLIPAGSAGEALDEERESVILYALDTTAQRQLEQQVAQAQKMNAVGQLAGGIAHDFNNVLQAIIGYSDLLLASHKPTDPAFQDIMQIKQNANRAAGLVRQLLAFSRRQTLRPEVMNVGESLSELTLLLKRLLGERVGLELKHGRDVWPVKADVNQFEQVIVNLAVNARDAMPGGGKLLIRTANMPDPGEAAAEDGRGGAPAGDHVLIEVSDTGEGIPPEIMEKIFEPFFTTKDIGKGTGLGLSTVFGIVKQSGGTIDVQSKVGEGTAFRIYLPRHIPEPEVEAEAEPALPRVAAAGLPASLPAEPAGPAKGQSTAVPKAAGAPEAPKPAARKPSADHTGQGTILLVEDEDPVRAVNSRALSARGYTVLEAASGIEALQIVRSGEHTIDLIVSDVVMPEMDGPTLLREVRKHLPELKVIFVSGYAEDAFRKNLPEGEAFNFLPKPFSLKQLVETVKKTMAG
ncbi:cell cycle histidine kinase CckA [Methylobacterium dankookense]|uniref:histidine kinase n=1 Tax=Methylobacterium dankookense TaxID=560405 RepID=A0A564G0P8_9HYPH|nr:PAS domain-containing sensor histidine kinase [Methylobacterium dankookense]GJD59677.1 Sensor kinase CckA [Methylobacterium dankookense]VUF14043.1 Sensor kinase CckA [Methylobacterium dankookense]